jgi:phosphatidylglycerophosphate synthase
MSFSTAVGKSFRWTSGNLITLSGLILTTIGCICFAQNKFMILEISTALTLVVLWIGVATNTLSFLLDIADGAVSRYHEALRKLAGKLPLTIEQERAMTLMQVMWHKGVTHFGMVFDPVVDKARFLALLWLLGPSISSMNLIVMMTIAEVALTLMRPILRFFKLGNGASNNIGRIKVWIQAGYIGLLAFTSLPLYNGPNTLWQNQSINLLTTSVGSVALLFAMASLGRHIESGWLVYRLKTAAQ